MEWAGGGGVRVRGRRGVRGRGGGVEAGGGLGWRSGGRLWVKAQCEGRDMSGGINMNDSLLRTTSLTSRT